MLQKKSGSNSPTKKFAFYVRHLIASNHLPDYTLTLEEDQVVFWRRGEGAGGRKPTEAKAAIVQPITPALTERRILISSQAMERLYEIAPRWDKHMLESMYVEWAKDKDLARDEGRPLHRLGEKLYEGEACTLSFVGIAGQVLQIRSRYASSARGSEWRCEDTKKPSPFDYH